MSDLTPGQKAMRTKREKYGGEAPEAGPAFAVLQVEDGPTPASTAWIEIKAATVVLRLAPDTPAVRIAEIATALGQKR